MLYKECLRIIEKKMPKVIVFENVRGLLSTKYIDGRKLVDVIVEDLSTMNNVGYNVDYKFINAIPEINRILNIVHEEIGIYPEYGSYGRKRIIESYYEVLKKVAYFPYN